MATPQCTVTMEAGRTHPRKGVALLEYPVPYVNAKDVFDVLSPSSERYHQKSFDYWMGGHHIQERFHGFKKSYQNGKYVECFVFKNIAEKERFYGFLCQPRANYQLCVLAVYAQKKENAQDIAELERAERMRVNTDVLAALRDPRLFSEGVGKNHD